MKTYGIRALIGFMTLVVIGGLTACSGVAGSKPAPPALTPGFSLSVASVSFGNQAGATTRSVSVSNPGTGNLVISALPITGANAGDFAAAAGTLPATVPAGGTLPITLTFTPAAPGSRAAVLTIADNAGGGPHTVTLSGMSLLQAASASVALSPNHGQAGTTVTVALQGAVTNFVQGSPNAAGTTADFGPGIVVGAGDGLVTVNSATSAVVQVQIGTQAAPGPRQIAVTTGGHIATATFQVLSAGSGPVANAGPAQFAAPGNTVRLDGSRSSCESGSSGCLLNFQWSFLSEPAGSTAQLTNPTGPYPSFTIDQPGNYVVQLQASTAGATQSAVASSLANANPGAGGPVSTLASVTVSTQNTSPVADAGPDQFVVVGATVQLDGSGSSDADGNALTYQWSFLSVPAGSTAALSDAGAVAPVFIADKDGAYDLQLTVNDGHGNTASGTVRVSTQPTAPLANAGPNQQVTVHELVHLDGSQSKAPDGDTLTYAWSFTFVPAGSAATLTGAATATPSFTADLAGAYGLQLVVTDSHGNSSMATVLITNDALPPQAVAGPVQQVPAGSTVQLDGSQSTGAPTIYRWTLLSKPPLSAAALSNAGSVKPTFVTDQPGFYVPQLVVSDGTLTSLPSTVLITATVAGFSVTPASAVFANQVVGTTSDSLPLGITNSGTGNLEISSLKISGANGEFSLTSAALPITVTPGNSTTVNLTFTPAALGARSATLTISDNAPGSPHGVALSGTGIAGPPASVTAVAGTPQSAVINTGFGTALQVLVTDATGDALSGVPVVFTAPASGASGKFTGGSGAATTNAQGVATAPPFTANGTVGAYTVTATVAGVASPASFLLTNLVGPAASVTATAGTPQTAMIGTAFPTALQASIKDAGGNPVSGVTVTFTAPASGAGGTFAGGMNTAVTNAQGVATAPVFTANTTAGVYSITASVSGVTPASYALTNLAGPAAAISATAGTSQSAAINTAFATALQATVTDASGNPVSGVTVTFVVPASGPSASFPGGQTTVQATTNAAGQATATALTANSKAGGPYNVTAAVSGVSATTGFALTNLAGPAAAIAVSAGASQSAPINTAFAAALQVTVTDAGNNPVSGVIVTFTAPGSGPSASFPGGVASTPVTTNAAGQATAPALTANSKAGGPYNVVAAVTGISSTVSFALTNLTGPATSVTATAGAPQSTAINTAFATALQATVKDAGGNPVSGVTVTFAAPGSGASGTFAGGAATATTNAQGVATAAVLTANSTAGSYTVTATAAGAVAAANFALTNLPGPPASVTATAGTPQSAAINAAFATALQATVKDAAGNPISGLTVTFTAPGTGASGSFAGGLVSAQATTNAAGQAAAPAFTANSKAGGPYTVTAAVTGVSAAASFVLSNLTGAPASVAVTAGGQQNATIDSAFAAALQVTVTDIGGNALSGATVTFTAPSSGASGSFAGGAIQATATTNAQGVATAPAFTANATAGSYTVTASVAGVTAVASFALTNQAGPAAGIAVLAGTPQSVTINGAFAALQVTVKDVGGNAVSGAAVTFTAPATGAGGTFAAGGNPAITNAQGVAAAPVFTANSTAGSYTVIATVSGVSTPASFLLTNLPGSAASVAAAAGSGQSVTINSTFPAALQVTIKDAGGNAVSGATVTFTAPATGASGTFASNGTTATAISNAQGLATATAFTANSVAGTYAVTAAVAGVSTPASFALTNLAGPPTSVTPSAGSGQSVTINSAFPAALQATIKDAGGNAVSGATVTFTAPATGASGIFAGNGTTATAISNAQGLAAAPSFTANSVAGAYAVMAAVAGVSTPASFALTNLAGPPASIAATAGTPQSAAINVSFSSALQATVRDASGNAVSGATVTFTAPASGASGTFAGDGTAATAKTNAQGLATAPAFTANSTAGNYTVNATVVGVAGPAVYALTNLAGPPASVTATAGTPQSATINSAFATALQAAVRDASGNPVSGATVTFTAPATGAGGSFAGGASAAVTNAQGIATAPAFTANSTAGSYTVNATVAGVTAPAAFALTNLAGPPASVTATAGTPQGVTINSAFATALRATVKDASGNPVSGATVTFTAPATGAGGSFAGGASAAVTNAQGIATAAAFTANSTAGSYTVNATVAGVATPATFAMTNLAGPAASVTPTAGAGQSATVNTSFATALQAAVKDGGGNAVSGVTVTFTAPASGASGNFAGGVNPATAATDAQGIATAVVFTANSTAGSYTVNATVAGVAAPAAFAFTNLAGPPASVTATAGTPQSITINTVFATALQVTVKDASGNAVSGVTVTFTAPASGAGGSFAGGVNTAVTNAQGVAATVFTANAKAGSYTVTAAVTGVAASASFALTNLTGPAANVAATAGTPQSVTINGVFAAPLQATVTDAGGNAVSGVMVTFTAPASGASGAFTGGNLSATAVTNAQGVATAPSFTANGTGGTYAVTAAAAGVTTPASFALTNLTPVITINPASVPFGNQLAGTSSSATALTIGNSGAGNLVITNLAITGTNPADFSFTAGPLPITVAPNGSTTVNVTFTPTLTNNRSAALTITDNAALSPQTVALTGTGTAPFIGLNPTSVSFGNQLANVTSAALPVTISNSNPANANLVISQLQITGTNAVEFAFTAGTLPITLAPNSSTTVNVTFTPAAPGVRSAVLAITDNDAINSGGSPHKVALSGNGVAPAVSLPASVAFASQLVNTTSPATNVTVTNTGTANVVIYGVAFTGSNTAEFAYSGVQQLTITPGNATSLPVTFTPTGGGARSAILNIYDNLNGGTQQNPHTDIVPLTGTGLTLGSLVMPPLSVGTNLEVLATVGLNAPASASLPITVTSPDTTKVLLSTSATQAGTGSVTVTVPKNYGFAYPGIYVQSLDIPAGAPDTVQLTVTAPGYPSITCVITLTPSALVLAGPQGIGQNFSTTLSGTVALSVSAYGLDTNGNISGSAQLLAGGLSATVSVTSSDTTVGVVSNSPGVLTGGSSTLNNLTFQPASSGNTQLTLVEPAGFSTPASGRQLTALVGAPQILLNPVTVGYQLQILAGGQLSDPAPVGGLTVTITSLTPGTALLSTSPTASGSSSIILTVPANTTALPAFYVQGLALGSGQLQASATGYNFSTGNYNGSVAITPSGFVLAGPDGTPGASFSTTTISGTTLLTLTLMRLDPGNHPAQIGQLMGGASASVAVTSGTPAAGQVMNSPVVFAGGDSSNSTLYFVPQAVGNSVLSVVQPAGFSTPVTGAQLTAVVSPPQITLSLAGANVGANLQMTASASLNAPAPNGGMIVTITSGNPGAVLLSPIATAQGTGSISVSVASGSGLNGVGFPQFYIQALQSSGTVTLTASAPGWLPGTATVTLTPSGFVLASPNGVGQDFGTYLSLGVNTTLTVQAMQLTATGTPQTMQALRGGFSQNVTVTSDTSYVGTIVGSPVTVGGGSATGSVTFHPAGTGVSLLTVWPPAGFTTPSSGNTLHADVN